MMHDLKKNLIVVAIVAFQCMLTGCSTRETPGAPLAEATLEAVESVEAVQESRNAESERVTATIEPGIIVVDYSEYFGEVGGSAVFYTPSENQYEVYNETDANERRSPCSTFKIISTLTALERGVITPEASARTWSGETFWNEKWNQDMESLAISV